MTVETMGIMDRRSMANCCMGNNKTGQDRRHKDRTGSGMHAMLKAEVGHS